MKGKELIQLIQERNLEEFEIKVIFTDGYNIIPNIRVLEITELGDIGYSEKVAYLGGDAVEDE